MAIRLPESIDSAALREEMERQHGVQIAGAFGLPIFRIGQMGEQCRRGPVLRTLRALGTSLQTLGWHAEPEAGVTAAETHLTSGGA